MDDLLFFAVLFLFFLGFVAVVLLLLREFRAQKSNALSEAGVREREQIRAECEMALLELRALWEEPVTTKEKLDKAVKIALKFPRAGKVFWKEIKGIFEKADELGLLEKLR